MFSLGNTNFLYCVYICIILNWKVYVPVGLLSSKCATSRPTGCNAQLEQVSSRSIAIVSIEILLLQNMPKLSSLHTKIYLING